MSNKLTVEVEKEEPKIKNVDIEEEGIPLGLRKSEDYRRGYKAGWEVAKKNLLRKLQSGETIGKGSSEEKPISKKKSKKEEEVSTLTWAILGLVLGGIVLFVIFNESNRKRNQSAE
jgi:hypothetical protein